MDESKVPRLARGCRLAPGGPADGPVLLMPEGILKLSASALRILQLCDGARSVAAIISVLQAEYPSSVHDKIRGDVAAYLAVLLEKKALELQ